MRIEMLEYLAGEEPLKIKKLPCPRCGREVEVRLCLSVADKTHTAFFGDFMSKCRHKEALALVLSLEEDPTIPWEIL